MKYLVCIDNEGYEASLEKRKLYKVNSETSDGLVSIIDESGESYLYPIDHFLTIPTNIEFEKLLDQIMS